MNLVRGLQERAARAVPASEVVDLAGWRLRHAPGCSWWVGTVLPHGEVGPDSLVQRIVKVESFYADRGALPRFQISPGCPGELDRVLAERGYRRECPMSLQVAAIAEVAGLGGTGLLRVELDHRPTAEWFDVWHAVNGHGADPHACHVSHAFRAEWDLLGRIDRPAGYACALIGRQVVAVGRAVADTGWAGVFGMATLPDARGKGAARSVLAALAGWAGARRADRIYLQVERANRPALRLYERAGFTELCGYHYRTAG